jgi:carboxypeptidase C (cathepsin A)
LHYWLTTSQSATPEKDPVVLWMNGGPGASSVVFGFFGELGPYFLDDDSMQNKTTPGVPDLKENPYAWNKIANVLFLESPANVGNQFCIQNIYTLKNNTFVHLC